MNDGRLAGLLLTLQRRARLGMVLGLAPTRRALAALGDPQRGLACVHIAGSNGKGSTSAMVASVARAAGLRVGLSTSPHLCRFAERIQVGGAPIDDDAFAHALAEVFARCDADVTFFEALTLAAFVAFREARVDLAVLEVGLGGRLDATNAIEAPLVTAVTSISLEHTAVLGPTIDAIAREKAAIAKPGSPLVMGPLSFEARRAVREVAKERGASSITEVSLDAAPDDARIAAWSEGDVAVIRPPTIVGGQTIRARLGLRGPHQIANAAVASGIAWHLARRFPRVGDVIAEGLAATTWPGRLERLSRGGVHVLLDCAHNEEGAAALAEALPAEGATPDRTTLVFGALADKTWPPVLERLAGLARRRIYTLPEGRAPVALAALAAVAPGEAVADAGEAVARAIAQSAPGDTVLVTGSTYLVGRVRGVLLGIACDPTIAL